MTKNQNETEKSNSKKPNFNNLGRLFSKRNGNITSVAPSGIKVKNIISKGFPKGWELDIAKQYITQGVSVVPITAGLEHPSKNWNTFDWRKVDLAEHFTAGCGVGGHTGKRSDDLIDVDADWPEARKIAAAILHDLPSFGRVSTPESHRICYLAEGEELNLEKYFLTKVEAAQLYSYDPKASHAGMIIELRGSNQSMRLPGSIHVKSGERIKWTKGDIPENFARAKATRYTVAELKKKAGLIAALSIFVRNCPGDGGRHDFYLALAGALFNAGYSEGDIEKYGLLVYNLTGENERDIENGIEYATKSTLNKSVDPDKELAGLPKLCELCGLTKLENKLRTWLNPESGKKKKENNYKPSIKVLDQETATQTLGDVELRNMKYAWAGYIPNGEFTLLAGDPKKGKSLVLAKLAYHLSNGESWPDGEACEQCAVLYLTQEDRAEGRLGARLKAVGCHPNNVILLNPMFDQQIEDENGEIKTERVLLNVNKNISLLEGELDKRPDIKFIMIDPLDDFLGGVDGSKNIDLRTAVAPLNDLCTRRDVGVIFVQHTRKDSSGTANDRIMGSRAYVAVARKILWVENEPENPKSNNRYLIPGAGNDKGTFPAWNFTIEEGYVSEGVGFTGAIVKWGSKDDKLDIEQIFRRHKEYRDGPKGESKSATAETWLQEKLYDGPLPQKSIEDDAFKLLISSWALKKAKENLGVITKKIGKHWYWSLEEFSKDFDANTVNKLKERPSHMDY